MLSLLASVVLAQNTPDTSPPPSPQSSLPGPAAPSPHPQLSVSAPAHPQPLSPRSLSALPPNWWYPPPQEVRPLPGGLDKVPLFNSNSPEVMRRSGILLSTFPPQGKRYPQAHLNYAFTGRFNIFAHHIAKAQQANHTRTLYHGLMLHNPGQRPVTVEVMQAASFLGTPDAPFINLPPMVNNDLGRVFSGPGSRVMDLILRGRRQTYWPSRKILQPGQSSMLMNLPVPFPGARRAQSVTQIPKPLNLEAAKALAAPPAPPPKVGPSSNTRSSLFQLRSSGPVHVASLALQAPIQRGGREMYPTLDNWKHLLVNGRLLWPRDIAPSPLNSQSEPFFYGRVAGVSRGVTWQAQVTDTPTSPKLTIPEPGKAFAYGLSTLPRGTFGTRQIQSAPMLVRYPDTAYLSHGNYGVHYQLTLPLHNSTASSRRVVIAIDTPLKQDKVALRGLAYLRRAPKKQVFFRGTVRARYTNDLGRPQTRYFHLVQHRGQPGGPLVILNLNPQESRTVKVDYLYPPDATPPQVLTIRTISRSFITESKNEPNS